MTNAHSSGMNVALVFLESSEFSQQQQMNALAYDLVLTGSTWNTALLKKIGLRNVHTIKQGVDVSTFPFTPHKVYLTEFTKQLQTPKHQTPPFVVFSGGKLEYRKGHDLVIRAMNVCTNVCMMYKVIA